MYHVSKITEVGLRLLGRSLASLVSLVAFGLALHSAAEAASLRLVWVNNSAAATAVRIERCIGVGCTVFTEIATVAGTVTTYTDATLTEITNASYRVRASVGTPATDFSSYSNTAGSKTGLNDPTGLVVDRP